MKATVVIDPLTLVYFFNKPNTTGKIAQWIILLQEFDLRIVHRTGMKHENVDFLSRMEKEEWVVSEDNDFPNAKLMTIDIDNEPTEYKYIIWYLKGMNFPNGATKQMIL